MKKKGKKGILVIHGFTGTPEVMESLTKPLLSSGYDVEVPLLAGHGTSLPDLEKTSWPMWYRDVLTSYEKLKSRAENVSGVGISLGSLLALKLAIDKKSDINAVVAISTPLRLTWPIEYLAFPAVKYSPARYFYRYQSKDWSKSVGDPAGRLEYKKVSYDKTPIKGVFEIFKLKKIVRKNLSEIVSPLMIIHARRDLVTPIENVSILRRHLVIKEVREVILGASKHVITMDSEKERASEAILDFFREFS